MWGLIRGHGWMTFFLLLSHLDCQPLFLNDNSKIDIEKVIKIWMVFVHFWWPNTKLSIHLKQLGPPVNHPVIFTPARPRRKDKCRSSLHPPHPPLHPPPMLLLCYWTGRDAASSRRLGRRHETSYQSQWTGRWSRAAASVGHVLLKKNTWSGARLPFFLR